MGEPDFDLAVVGGGIHGVGVAQAGAAAGHRVLLLEQSGFASGTSSRSSKLIHGGLRYLETAQFALVRESLAERRTLLRIAPHLVQRVPFFVPIYHETRRRPWQIRAGLSLYALLGGLRTYARFRRVGSAEWGGLDGLRVDGLEAVFRYWDAQTDDAELTRAVARSAEQLGATVCCPARFTGAERSGDGWLLTYDEGGRRCEARSRALVNAAGPWVNRVLDLVRPAPAQLEIELVQGAHVVLPGAVERGVYYTEAPSDGRAVFIMPWYGDTLVGTTETVFTGRPDEVRPLAGEIDYLLETFRHYFPGKPTEVCDSFAGLRVLPRGDGRPFERARETVFHPDDPAQPRLITLYGGKLTAYRASGQKTLRLLRETLPPRTAGVDTARLTLPE